MSYPVGTFLSTEIRRTFVALATLLVLPVTLALWFRQAARQRAEDNRAAAWLSYRRLSRFIMAATVATWWAIWDLNRVGDVLAAFVPWLSGWLGRSSVETLLFWIPPMVSLGAFLVLANATDAALLKLKWTVTAVFRLAWWRLMNFVFPLLLLATGFDDIFHGDLWGCALIIGAGIIATIATIYLRKAEGMKMHEVKSSETRNRALAMARKMKIDLRRIYVVPAGRGHLTNAFGGGGSICLTDNLGKYLDRQQIDFVIAHELAHVQQRHWIKNRLEIIAIFTTMALTAFWFRRDLLPYRPLLDVFIILAPLAAFYLLSHRDEYEADRRAVEFTGEPENGIRALARMYRDNEALSQFDKIAMVFQTHPALVQRAEAIGRAGEIPPGRISEILRQELASADTRKAYRAG
jgi:Zn-dependent protease with chaperone function